MNKCNLNVDLSRSAVAVRVTSVLLEFPQALLLFFPIIPCTVVLKWGHGVEEDEEEVGGAVSPLISVHLYGGCGSVLSAWISCWARLPDREDGEASGVFPLSDSPSLQPLVPHRPPPAHQTCQTCSHHHLLGGCACLWQQNTNSERTKQTTETWSWRCCCWKTSWMSMCRDGKNSTWKSAKTQTWCL